MPILQSPSFQGIIENPIEEVDNLPYLDNDSLYHIFSKVVDMSPIHKAVVLRVIF